MELATIRLLVDAGVLVICGGGGGGIPVVSDAAGRLHGVEAVIDKDLSASLLAARLDADVLLMLTDVPAVEIGWGTAAASAIRQATPDELRRHTFEAGSMAPKIEAACRFVEQGGRVAAIGRLEEAESVLDGGSGTRISLR